MRFILFISIFLAGFFSNANSISLVDVPVNVFVNGGKTNFDSIFHKTEIQSLVKEIFEEGILFHDYTLEVHPNSNFKTYWSVFQDKWNIVDLNNDGEGELILQGLTTTFDEKEFVEIYKKLDGKWTKIYGEVGRLLAYKIHPNTKKIILYQHKYPCCNSASHTIITLRFLRNKIVTKSSFFVGRDSGDMVGPFFPDSVSHPSSFEQLQEKTLLRWSPEIVNQNAFTGYSDSNAIVHFDKGAYYKVLYNANGWSFVLMYSGIIDEQAIVINPSNFVNKPIYGWISKDRQ
jgi:hypothetical protein